MLLILRRRWRLLALVWGATLAAVGVYTFTTTRLFRPQATLEIRPETPVISTSEVNDPAMMASRIMWENYYRTQEAILTSPSLVEAVFRSLPDVRTEFSQAADPVRAFTDRIDIEKVRTSFILKVGFVDRDGDKAKRIVNTMVSLYLDDANKRLRDIKSGAVEALATQTLPAIRQKVDDADRAVQAFQAESGFIDFEEHYRSLVKARQTIDSRQVDIRLRRAKLKSELEALSGYGGDGVSGIFNPAFHATRSLEPLVQDRARVASDLARDRKLLKEKHPRIQELEEQLGGIDRRIRESVQGTLLALQTDLRSVELEEKALVDVQASVDREIGEAGRKLTNYRRLESELASAKDLYNAYLKKHGETSATSGASLASVRVVDPAVTPQVPFKPKVLMNLALGGVLGLLMGVGAVFLTEQLDDRIASAREVEAFVGLDVLAVIPSLDQASKAGASPILLDEGSPLAEFEAFRSLRAEVVTRLEKVQGARVIGVLSALQSEGKSTVSLNLAKVLAMEGRRVLLFDADMHRPSLRPVVSSPDVPGLEKVLRGEVPIDRAVRPSRIPGVDVIGASEGTSGAAELAGTPRFAEALDWAKSRYDVVLLDLAPVNQVSESALLARRLHGVVLVVREARTGRGAVQLAKKRLLGMEANLLGAVVNCASPRGSGYGYYSYYGYGSRRA
jgi:capsular exopolysaccharide synthesis family protein